MHVRIRELANLFPRGCYLIDVGSDHGHLGIQLLRENKAIGVVNIDLSRDALARSEQFYRSLEYQNRATFIACDGFTGLVSLPENSVAVIAGMGTAQILRILERFPANLQHLILLSHTDYYKIRKWAFANFFFIKNEKYVEDGDFVYLILDMVRFPRQVYGELEDYIFGREEFRNGDQRRLFEKYWLRNSKRIFNIPIRFRDEIERATLRFLEREGIV